MRDRPLPTVRATPMFRSRTALHSFALWLALSAVVLRSLIPVGFMPGWTGTGEEGGRWLIICPASPLSAALAPPANKHAGHHDHAAMMAAMAKAHAADPHAAHRGMANMAADMAGMSHDMHAGHDPAQHEAHRIASEHQSCPFAGAVAPALPVSLARFALAIPVATLGRPATTVSTATASQRRLPPARAPPAVIDTYAA